MHVFGEFLEDDPFENPDAQMTTCCQSNAFDWFCGIFALNCKLYILKHLKFKKLENVQNFNPSSFENWNGWFGKVLIPKRQKENKLGRSFLGMLISFFKRFHNYENFIREAGFRWSTCAVFGEFCSKYPVPIEYQINTIVDILIFLSYEEDRYKAEWSLWGSKKLELKLMWFPSLSTCKGIRIYCFQSSATFQRITGDYWVIRRFYPVFELSPKWIIRS